MPLFARTTPRELGFAHACQNDTLTCRKRLTSSLGASLMSAEGAPSSAMVFVEAFAPVRTIIGVAVYSKSSPTACVS